MRKERYCYGDQGIEELVGGLAGLCGVGLGLVIGGNAVEYAKEYVKTVSEHPDLLTALVNGFPLTTQVMTAAGVGYVTSKIGRILGKLLDYISSP